MQITSPCGKRLVSFLLVGSIAFSSVQLTPAQVVVGQTDTFEGGTVANWAHGSGTPGDPSVGTGGPAGGSDHFLNVVADGSADGGKLLTYNRTQWTGDYVGQGIDRIEMDLQGFSSPGNADLSIRIVVRSGTTFSSPGYVSTAPFTLAVDGQWHHASFDLSAMTAVGTPPSLSSLLADVKEFRIIHSAAGNSVHGDQLVATLGIDNISAVPEPSSALVVSGLLAAGLFLRRYALCGRKS